MIDDLLIPLLKILFVLNATLVGVTYMVLLERKVIAWAQSRLGPMRVGPYGILQPVADAVKLMIKEDITPVRADRSSELRAHAIEPVPERMRIPGSPAKAPRCAASTSCARCSGGPTRTGCDPGR